MTRAAELATVVREAAREATLRRSRAMDAPDPNDPREARAAMLLQLDHIFRLEGWRE